MADLGSTIFSEGQIYVALSRVQSLSGLHLINIDFNKIKASSKALQFYASQSKQNYSTKRKRKCNTNSEVIWYKESKNKKQAQIIKDVINEEIKNIPCGEYKNLCNNKKIVFLHLKNTSTKILT